MGSWGIDEGENDFRVPCCFTVVSRGVSERWVWDEEVDDGEGR